MTSQSESQNRSDSVEEKISLLQAAGRAGQLELAMSLAESIKDTLVYERTLRGSAGEADLAASDFEPVGELPPHWRRWASGWQWFKTVALDETLGLARHDEPVHLLARFRCDQVTDLRRELRVARLDEGTGLLEEVTSQVDSESYQKGERQCRVSFLARAPAHGRAYYLLFYGNQFAEIPDYQTDLRTRGEGFGIDVENSHYVAKLSRQMGQIERLICKNSQNLELFVGGNGHGEPPHVDWAHDYLASGGLQKFRMTNWSDCPNFEVVRGPIFTSVRRWGFPHGPVHPLFTPSRMHLDVTYTFYASVPYFFKQGHMEAVKEFDLIYLRDDEWVFSGYTFDDTLWMGPDGRLREGPVEDGMQDDLWAAGFYNRTNRLAFVSLRLEHAAEGFDGTLYHGGGPSLNALRGGHGQLWSRWAARENPHFRPGARLKQRNAYFVTDYPAEGGAESLEEHRRRLLHPLAVSPTDVPSQVTPAEGGRLARNGEVGEVGALKDAIWKALRDCRDEQIYGVDSNVVDLGYVYDVRVRNGSAHILMTMPHRGRPKYNFVANPIRQRVVEVPGVEKVDVELTWEPAWNVHRLTGKGRAALGLA